MAIVPDTKDWTWVLERPCPECSFDVRSFPREQVGAMIRDNAERWQPMLENPAADRRPSETVWSALEYACHVRDVFRLYDERLRMMLETDDPSYPNWDQDAASIEDGYGEQDPARVAADLAAAAKTLATRFDQVAGDQWERTGKRSDGANFTVESFARYLIHDPVHHIWDVNRGFDRLGSEGQT
ncbi:MAG TPA: DinB family protein [Actinomycetota bacterium]|nr:DinB family protein [Actinomycetota bacterium]